MQSPLRQLLIFSLFNLAMALVVLAVHFWPGNNSMLNLNSWDYMNPNKGLNEAYLEEVITFHQTEPTFARRTTTTLFIKALHRITGLTLGQSFVVFNFLMLWFTGIVIGILSLLKTKNLRNALLSGLLFWLSFPVLFAFFPTIYSYDDPLMYLFLALMMFAIYRNKIWPAASFFVLACVARESALIMLPGIIVLLNDGFKISNIKTSFKKWWPFLAAIVVFVGALLFQQYGAADASFAQDSTRRFKTLFFNFQNRQFAVESFISFVLVCYLAIVLWRKNNAHTTSRKAFYITLVLNTAVVLLFTQARESRLFMLPLFFWFPFAGELLLNNCTNLYLKVKEMAVLKSALIVAVATLFAAFIAFTTYQPTAMLPYENWHQEYLFVLLIFTALTVYATPPPIKNKLCR